MIDPEELAAALDGPADARPVVLDARFNLTGPDGHGEHLAGHIPGSVFVGVHPTLAGPAGAGGRHPLPDPDDFAAGMRAAGVDDDRTVVVTDGGTLLAAARLWWLLTDAGHERVQVLDGGFAGWRDAGLPVAVGEEPAPAPGSFSARPGRLARVTADEVAEAASSGRRPVVDVRTAERYEGRSEPIDPVAGHIPGAVNRPAGGVFDERGRLRPAAQLRDHFATVGDDPILYCGSGLTASQSLLALRVAGRTDGAVYAGSWSGWITDPSRPVATGSEPV